MTFHKPVEETNLYVRFAFGPLQPRQPRAVPAPVARDWSGPQDHRCIPI